MHYGPTLDLSICLPGYRIHNWEKFYNSVYDSCKRYRWEVIICGPQSQEELPESLRLENNFRYIQDLGSPARCGQIATTFAQGEYLTWSSDDGYFLENSLDNAIDLIKSKTYKDIMAMRYLEGQNFQGVPMSDEWYRARHHADQKLPGILDHYMIAPVAMFNTNYFRELGGWDTNYLHINMSQHDLCFRAQKNGSKIYLSPDNCSTHDWDVNAESWRPMANAYQLNDLPLFQKHYAEFNPNRIFIDYHNWKNSPDKWERTK